jgi:uncharacterized DUF497 family protein
MQFDIRSRLKLGHVQLQLDPSIFCAYNNSMQIEFDPDKRARTLLERGLDFARVEEVFAVRHFTAEDVREAYGEPRYITVGALDGRMVVLVWTPRGEVRRIISMRKANEREQARYAHRVG